MTVNILPASKVYERGGILEDFNVDIFLHLLLYILYKRCLRISHVDRRQTTTKDFPITWCNKHTYTLLQRQYAGIYLYFRVFTH